MGLSAATISTLRADTAKTMPAARVQMLRRGKYNWQLLKGTGAYLSISNCTEFMRPVCRGDYTTVPWLYVPSCNARCHSCQWCACGASCLCRGSNCSASGGPSAPFDLPDLAQQLAAFLLGRGDYAWFGYSWVGCDWTPATPALLDTDIGEPISRCAEVRPGVFQRQYSQGLVELDCSSFAATIPK